MTTSWQKILRAGYYAFDALNEVILEQETRIDDLEELAANLKELAANLKELAATLKDELDAIQEELKNARDAGGDEMAQAITPK